MYRTMEKKMKFNNLRDFFMFGKVLSAGLVVAGYAFFGVWLSNWLSGLVVSFKMEKKITALF